MTFDASVFEANAVCLGDPGDIFLTGFLSVALSTFAHTIIERVITPKSARNDMVVFRSSKDLELAFLTVPICPFPCLKLR